ncbi:MAG TPA: hypothetical protein VMU34_16570 [Mycobacterium sp.]|nr:hypothetical protein [Mycobacterium sp.]
MLQDNPARIRFTMAALGAWDQRRRHTLTDAAVAAASAGAGWAVAPGSPQ